VSVLAAARRIRPLLAFALMCACALMYAQRSAREPYRGTAPGPYSIAGALVNASTGEPVRRALVQALDDSGHTVASSVTNSDGRFSLDRLGAAKYQLIASKRGFRAQSYDEHDEFASSIVTGPDQDTTHLNFRLMPNAVLYGTVTDDNGEPVANAHVLLFRRPKHPGQTEHIQQADAAQTDDTGEYEIGNLAAGEYLLAVTAEPWYAIHDAAKRNRALDVVYPVTYFDSTTDEQAATPIELAGGMRQEADISLNPVQALRLSVPAPRKSDGSLARPELQQVIFGTIVTSQSAGFLDAPGTGSVELGGLAPGQYELTQGEPPHVLDLNLTASQQVNPGAGAQEGSFAGRMRMVSGTPVPDQVTVSLERIDNTPGQSQYATEAHQGRFRFDSIAPGEYTVSATGGDKGLPVLAIGTSAARQAGNLITIRERTPEITVILSEADTRVDGFAIKDGKGFAGAMMVLLPKNTAQWKALTRRDQTNSDGSFSFNDVAPGEYTALAIEDGWPLDWSSPAVMARYLPGGTNVTVTVNSTQVVRLPASVPVQSR
jgi:5-hydroxyisourate hydrolase-like protein (transthyretin family)